MKNYACSTPSYGVSSYSDFNADYNFSELDMPISAKPNSVSSSVYAESRPNVDRTISELVTYDCFKKKHEGGFTKLPLSNKNYNYFFAEEGDSLDVEAFLASPTSREDSIKASYLDEKVAKFAWGAFIKNLKVSSDGGRKVCDIFCVVDLDKYSRWISKGIDYDPAFKAGLCGAFTWNRVFPIEKNDQGEIVKIYLGGGFRETYRNFPLAAIGEAEFDIVKDRKTGDYVPRGYRDSGHFDNFAIKQIDAEFSVYSDEAHAKIREKYGTDLGLAPTHPIAHPTPSSTKNKTQSNSCMGGECVLI